MTFPFEGWILSDNPSDWVAWLTLLVTTIYVFLTYFLFRAAFKQASSASDTARLAFEQLQSEKLERLLPVQITVDDIAERVKTWLENYGSMDFQTFIQQSRPAVNANFTSTMLNDGTMTASRISVALYRHLRDSADDLQQLAVKVESLWPYEGNERVPKEALLAAAKSHALSALNHLREASALVEQRVAALRGTSAA